MTVLLHPTDSAYVAAEFDGLDGATISQVTMAIPATLVQVGSVAIDNDAALPTAIVRLSGAAHGVHYQVTFVATLSNGDVIARTVPCMGFSGT